MKKLSYKKQILAIFISVVMIASCLPAFNIDTKGASAPANVRLNIAGTKAALTWGEVSGATEYIVYEADSRYAAFKKAYTCLTPDTRVYLDAKPACYYQVTAVVGGVESPKSIVVSQETQLFGYNTYIFEDTDDKAKIQSVIDGVYKTSEKSQFGSERQAFMFAPSDQKYDVKAKIGFYTQVAGLGVNPKDTNISEIQCLAEWMKGRKADGSVNYNALCNFWRSVENLSTPKTHTTFAVSQATSMRKMNFTGSTATVPTYNDKGKIIGQHTNPNYAALYLHQEGGYASGGFMADTKIATFVSSGSQQQWLSRNIYAGSVPDPQGQPWNYQQAVWNNVLVGSNTSITQSDWPRGASTVVNKTPEVCEKPYLTYIEEQNKYKICVPTLRKNTNTVSWDDYKSGVDYNMLDVEDCYIAKPTDTAAQISAGISDKDGLIFTPGIYNLEESINIDKKDFVVLGLGYATLKPANGNDCIVTSNTKGIRIAGLLFDAGGKQSTNLLKVGVTKTSEDFSDNPIVLSDCFFRVGGASEIPGRVKNCVEINVNNTICDNFWVWRADHGKGVGWTKNTADTGVIFNGDNITAYGLMVEHFQKYQTVWNGNGGKIYMYQSELPYDIPSQGTWNAPGTYGYADIKIANGVDKFDGYGIGIYSCYQKAQCFLKSAIECPDKPNVKFTNVCTYSLSGNGGIDYVINKGGYGVYGSGDMAKVLSYANKSCTCDKKGEALRKYIWTAGIDVNTENRVYTGKAFTPAVTVKYKGVTLRKGTDYKITYKNNVKIGKASVVVTGLNNFQDYEVFKFKIVPGKTKITKAKGSKKKIKLKYKKVKGAGGYQIVYAKNKKFKKKKTIKTKKTKYTIKRKDKKRKKYYVKIRAYKKVSGKYYYGSYTKKKKVK